MDGPSTRKVLCVTSMERRLDKHLDIQAREADTLSDAYPIKDPCIPPEQRLLSRCRGNAGYNGWVEEVILRHKELDRPG